MKIIESINRDVLKKSVQRARERGVILPTFAQQKNPSFVPQKIVDKLKGIGLWDINPLNLFRITWKNEPKAKGGGFGEGNWVEFPPELTGVPAKIVGLAGKFFPTGAHKVGAAYGCLVPRLVSGNFDPTTQKAVWPSTGNYCRGGAYDCALLACPAVAILPEGMSRERFEWLKEIGTDEIIATPGTESNVKEIYDKCWELRRERGNKIVIFNQFEEFGNSIWHYNMTGGVIEEIYQKHYRTDRSRLAAYISATGSAGTIAAGDFLRTKHPFLRVVATEALQCPTLYQYGFGAHRIEGIGDKHVPWIHNVRNTDAVAAIDDEQVMQLLRLFNEPAGLKFLEQRGVKREVLDRLSWLGISCICNLVAAIKTARYFDMGPNDVIFTPLTDSMDLYTSRKQEMEAQHGKYDAVKAAVHYARYLEGCGVDFFRELTYFDRKALHNFKYFTWVEQQGKDSDELRRLWDEDFWKELFSQAQVDEWDRLITEFNDATGVLKAL
ncbi:MAG TPA: pyridoxal-phosphate dependent enzyme [Kiritimatiellia bacterium]|nr:pyridoxal-phosphate dependent enzyme [Kiritimatiellia bacterium]HRZ13400.1 pyridoxal-phosphate dependent enzyme [Kiritimatiellia bacterium]HSA18960.1 pyridoxal-phosphate dependent enzyme [Kiritimatiellia bacterium]